MGKNLMKMFSDTVAIFERGFYEKDGRTVHTLLSPEQRRHCRVYLPDEVRDIMSRSGFGHIPASGPMAVSCRNADSFGMAWEQHRDMLSSGEKGRNILVLNFANPVNPGGGVRRGARAQEEDLCRKSSLLYSLESEEAREYYSYNKSLKTYMGSDAIILTPEVEIIRDAEGELLDEPFTAAVMTCAAPMVTEGIEGMTEEEYRALFYNRICAMLKCAAYWGYGCLVLGAFGCGAFANDARLVSDLFYRALKEFCYDGMGAEAFFRRIDFAVLSRRNGQYNFREFERNFADYYRDGDGERAKMIKRERESLLDAVRGCLFGGAAGDALGYAVEFLQEEDIFRRYGGAGITEYAMDRVTGKAVISDDTQMTLFTANGLLVGKGRGEARAWVAKAYLDWFYTQTVSFEESGRHKVDRVSWLCDVPELYARRAPGSTCLSALTSEARAAAAGGDYIGNPKNNSKGCGGVMRVAPVALDPRSPVETLDMEAAQIAAITHGHSLGYMPAAVLCHIISHIVFPAGENRALRDIVLEAKAAAEKLFAGDEHLPELSAIIDRALALAENGADDLENIHALGQGWVAEETLAIAIYCSVKYSGNFSKGIIAAANHSGDSDSTAAVTGNILGALLGYEAIEPKWKAGLECADIILELADDLCRSCLTEELSRGQDPAWESKYIHSHRWYGKR